MPEITALNNNKQVLRGQRLANRSLPDHSVLRKSNREARSRAEAGRQAKNDRLIESLRRSDIKYLWTELRRIVQSHPLVHARGADLLVEENVPHKSYDDLTQELFVQLLSKGRFQHYLDTRMTDAEIERQISQIELTNLLTTDLRKRYPESYRLARRISNIIQSNKKFCRFDTNGEDGKSRLRLVNQVYGLRKWPRGKSRRDKYELEQRIQAVTMRRRDRRMPGRTGDTQVVISNSELEKLIICVFEAVDAPLDIRTLRSLVMSRLPVINIYLVPVDKGDANEIVGRFEPVDVCENPEQRLLRQEAERRAAGHVNEFLRGLNQKVRGKFKKYDLILSVLWHCYLSPDHSSQLEVASKLGVSDTLVSRYRQYIEEQLRLLSLLGLEEARCFEIALRAHVSSLVRQPPDADKDPV